MTDLVPIAVGMVVVVDPVRAVLAGDRDACRGRARRAALAAGALAWAVLAAAAIAAEPVLDRLDISAPSAQLAAGIVVAVAAVGQFLGRAPGRPPWARLLPPAAVVATVAWSAAEGPGVVVAAAVPAVAVAAAATAALPPPASPRVRRLVHLGAGAASAIVAATLVRAGVFGT